MLKESGVCGGREEGEDGVDGASSDMGYLGQGRF
jgi:hypothetical protein